MIDLTRPASIPLHPDVMACPHCRTPESYEQAVTQFQVETAPRYQAGGGATFCNIFAADVARAMAAELPHWWMGRELTANNLFDWLLDHGGAYGWERVPVHAAQGAVQAAMFTVAVWQNRTGGHGHIAVLLPREGDEPTIAQAGAHNFYGRPLSHGFGADKIPFYFTCR